MEAKFKRACPTFRRVDEKQFGGGPGMVMQIEPILKAIQSILSARGITFLHPGQQGKACLPARQGLRKATPLRLKIVLFAPSGKQFTQKMAMDFAKKDEDIILICGHYEGIDARLKKVTQDLGLKTQDISIGPYVLTGGELPSAVVIDAVSRHIPGVLGKQESLEDERGIGIPVYTRPEVFEFKSKKYKVPKVLLSGHHEKIKEWRKKQIKLK